MDLVGGDMTDRFIDAMIFDMRRRATYPRLSIAGASGGNTSEIMWTRIYLYQVQIFGVSHGTRAEAEQLVEWIHTGRLRPVLHGAFPLSRLRAAGVGHAEWTRHCTYSDPERFFSYRRSVHAKEADYGRLISAIML